MNGTVIRQRLAVYAGILLLGLGMAGTAQAESAMDAMQIAREQNKEWNRLFNTEQADKLARLYAEDALVSPANGEVIEGRSAIRDLFKGYIESGLDKHRLTVIKAGGSDDWFYEVAEWRVTGAPENAVIPLYKGIVTIVFRRGDDGDWYIRSHTWNQEPE